MKILITDVDIADLIMLTDMNAKKITRKTTKLLYDEFIEKYGVQVEKNKKYYVINIIDEPYVITNAPESQIILDCSRGSKDLFTKIEALEKMCELYLDFANADVCIKLKLMEIR